MLFRSGGLDDLVQVRAAVQVPVLRKDFIIDALQIEEAAAAGADAVLLIAAILSPGQLRAFREQAAAYGMDALVEVHDEAELESTLTSKLLFLVFYNIFIFILFTFEVLSDILLKKVFKKLFIVKWRIYIYMKLKNKHSPSISYVF